jgi:hypothetical protein
VPQSDKSHIHKLAPSPKPSGGRVYASHALICHLPDQNRLKFDKVKEECMPISLKGKREKITDAKS